MEQGFKHILRRISRELPGFVAAAVVLVEDGLPVAELSLRPEVEAMAAAAYLTSVVKANRRAARLLSGDPVTSDILILHDRYSFIIRPMGNMPYFLFVMTVREEWLGRVRLVLDKYEKLMERTSVAIRRG